jgi:3-hydroxyisobutyrate dehydrogenase-like beta-hydroxyacid dehydrogenase
MAQQLYQLWISQGAGGQDFSSIINLFKKPV